MKKILEYMTIAMSVLGTLCMIGGVGSIEVDKYLQGGSMAMLGLLVLFLRYIHNNFIRRKNNVLYFRITYGRSYTRLQVNGFY